MTSSTVSKIKTFFLKAFRGKKTESANKNNVRWEAVLEEDRSGEEENDRRFGERLSIATFPSEELTHPRRQQQQQREHIFTDPSECDESIHVTRASIYVSGDWPEKDAFVPDKVWKLTKVNSTSRLIDMSATDTAVNISVDEGGGGDDDGSSTSLESTDVPSSANQNSMHKMCYGPELNFDVDRMKKNSPLSTFVHDVENELKNPQIKNAEKGDSSWNPENKFESNNSLDIEKELNELMGTLCVDLRNLNSQHVDRSLGSRINMAFELNEPEIDLADGKIRRSEYNNDYWANQRAKSKSYAERCKLGKFIRRGKQRMSMIELRNNRKRSKNHASADSAILSQCDDYVPPSEDFKGSGYLGTAYDRSSLIEPRVSSTVSLARRPQSALDNTHCSYEASKSAVSSIVSNPTSVLTAAHSSDRMNETGCPSVSPRLSKSFTDSIDWTWLEEAITNINAEYPQEFPDENPSLRVDAECQTQLESSWQGEEERMRNWDPSPRVSDAAPNVNSECRIVNESGMSGKDMAGKAFIEGGGTSVGSSWLRQSMRRIRHFNLEDPTRIRSAPPDGFARGRTEGDESNSAVNQNVINNRLTGNVSGSTGNESQLIGSEEIRSQRRRRNRNRSRPSSAPGRRSNAGDAALNQQQLQQQQIAETETSTSSPNIDTLDNLGYESDSMDRHPAPRSGRHRHIDEESEESEERSPLGPWPHGLSSVFAGLGCTLGLFNISRFAVLSVHFGSNFIIQFLVLSLLLGVPLLAFHAALGQTLGAGPVDMWKISPLFQGIGIALLLAQALIGMYSIVGVSWMFVYFRDSFITKQDSFRWAEPFRHYRQDNIFATSILNTSGRLEETVPDYLNVVVLQRHGLTSPENAFGHLKFQLTFNLAVVWMIVFVSLSKGLRSYGKVVYVFSLLPVFGVLIISSKLLGFGPIQRGFFPQTEWSEFFLNAKSWISAATEVMLTWNLLGVATMQVTSHNRSSKKLWRDIATIILITLLVLILAAFLGNLCHQLISLKGYTYVPSSFERISTYSFLRPSGPSYPPIYSVPTRHMPHASLVAGERVGKPGSIHESGYQVLRLATELIPATLAILEGHYLSPFWAVLFYFTLILFGIAQQLAIWHCVITGIMAINAPILKSWETTITFFTCAAGFILGLPMTTELGIFVVYFLDYCLGGGWWVSLLTLIEICAIFMVRGRPYSGENISIALFGKNTNCFSLWAIPLLTFTWNVIMPVALLVMSITIFKSGGYRDLWIWKCSKGDYWPLWTREVGVLIQIIPLLCIPVVGLVQCYRYLSKGPADIFDRLANLYRPASIIRGVNDEESTATASNISALDSRGNGTAESPAVEDPPPKYTPPPSYSTATGTRIAKLLRQSFRRSVRRLQTALGQDSVNQSRPPPPDYVSVLVEINQSRNTSTDTQNSPPPTALSFTAADVAQVLRCSFRRSNNNSSNHQQQSAPQNQQQPLPTSNGSS